MNSSIPHLLFQFVSKQFEKLFLAEKLQKVLDTKLDQYVREIRPSTTLFLALTNHEKNFLLYLNF